MKLEGGPWSGSGTIPQSQKKCLSRAAIGGENAGQVNFGDEGNGCKTLAILAEQGKFTQAKVEGATLQEMQFAFDLTGRQTGRDFGSHGIGFFQKKSEHFGKAFFAEFGLKFGHACPVNKNIIAHDAPPFIPTRPRMPRVG